MKTIQEAVPAEDYEKFKKGELDLDVPFDDHMDFEIEKKFDVEEEEQEVPEGNIFRKGARIIESKPE